MANKGKHLTDKQKKRIIATYAETGNFRETARLHKISDTTVKRIVKSNPEISEKIAQKKDENTEDILAWLDGRTNNFKVLWQLAEKRTAELIPHATDIQRIWTGLGIIVDKMAKGREMAVKVDEAQIKREQFELEKQKFERNANISIEDIQKTVDSLKDLFNHDISERHISDYEE